ncbi:hypothetical protein, partial [Segatella copri]
IPRALPWARSFWAFSPYLNHIRNFSKKVKSATPLGVKGETPGGVAFYGCTAKRFMVVQLKGVWLYN